MQKDQIIFRIHVVGHDSWQSADIIMALMAMTNLTAILLLSPTVRIIASDYAALFARQFIPRARGQLLVNLGIARCIKSGLDAQL
jgi:hypothetical protein